jgi:ABC-2 type transport system permease protein
VLPLTVVNNALRAIANEGAGLAACGVPLAILMLWAAVAFAAALAWFRWE